MPNPLNSIRIILVEPAGALNVGSIARVMKNMGMSQLVLVKPRCHHLGTDAQLMAVHALEILETARVVVSLSEGLVGCHRAIATTGRPRIPEITLETPRVALPWLLDPTEPGSAALIFGPEDRGLNTQELNQAQRFVSIPANPEYSSLNLAQAVAVCCYELYQSGETARQTVETELLQPSSLIPHPSTLIPHPASAPLEQLEGFYQQLESVLLAIGYLYPHTAESRIQKFRRLFGRAMPTSDEVSMLRGILSQMIWALEQRSTSDSTQQPKN